MNRRWSARPTRNPHRAPRPAWACAAVVWLAALTANSYLAAADVDFDSQIVPALTRSGCNAGACHGAAAGRGGFRLSLLGSDPAADYEAIVVELEGRRVNLARPAASLLLKKPAGELAHEGGRPLDPDGPAYELVRNWIQAGAPRGRGRRLVAFEVSASRRRVERVGERVELRATARFDGGEPEDVTRWTLFVPADPSALELDPSSATVTARRAGELLVLARFLDRVAPLVITLPWSEQPLDVAREEAASEIDREVMRKLADLRIAPRRTVRDDEFLRRATIDLLGRLPEVDEHDPDDEYDEYDDGGEVDRRARIVDRLLAHPRFVERWTWRFAEWFRLRALPHEPESAEAFHAWLRTRVRDGASWSEMARELVTASGDSHQVGAANFSRLAGDARQETEWVGGIFLGVRLQCANCHNHPLDRWTQADYHGLAALFAPRERGRIVSDLGRGAVTNPRTGQPATPRLPGGPDLESLADARGRFAAWLTDDANPYFSRAFVNRVWRVHLGWGLIEPVDDLRETNPATHPELLELLARRFRERGGDLRTLVRDVTLSDAYRREEMRDASGAVDRYYAAVRRREWSPETRADVIAQVTGVPDRYGDLPLGTRAQQLVDPATPAESLDVLGRCSRATSCEGPNASPGGLAARLHLLNGPVINAKLAAPEGVLQRLLSGGASDEEIVDAFYWRALSRRPSGDERAYWLRQFAGLDPAARREACEDFVWSLLQLERY